MPALQIICSNAAFDIEYAPQNGFGFLLIQTILHIIYHFLSLRLNSSDLNSLKFAIKLVLKTASNSLGS